MITIMTMYKKRESTSLIWCIASFFQLFSNNCEKCKLSVEKGKTTKFLEYGSEKIRNQIKI